VPPNATVGDLGATIEAAVLRAGETDIPGMRVNLLCGRVILIGNVHTWFAHEEARRPTSRDSVSSIRTARTRPKASPISSCRTRPAIARVGSPADGEFYVERGGPWIRLPLGEGEWRVTGLSRSQILDGDPRVATLVLAAVIDYHLHESESRREDIEYGGRIVHAVPAGEWRRRSRDAWPRG